MRLGHGRDSRFAEPKWPRNEYEILVWSRIAAQVTDFTRKEGAPMSALEAQEVRHLLLKSHDEYRQLAERHHQLDDRLHELSEKHYLSDAEQFEEVTIKKRKLALKDEMERIARNYASTRARMS
jgi:uncharacterized protein YdcH (DUF465 family)